MKKIFENAEIELVRFEAEDVIITSTVGNGGQEQTGNNDGEGGF